MKCPWWNLIFMILFTCYFFHHLMKLIRFCFSNHHPMFRRDHQFFEPFFSYSLNNSVVCVCVFLFYENNYLILFGFFSTERLKEFLTHNLIVNLCKVHRFLLMKITTVIWLQINRFVKAYAHNVNVELSIQRLNTWNKN